ncbi:MAG TPA: N-acetylneuraminate synthase family protein [Phnomibacter sp.]|nr:N-acetylneuraminate synthase family protein [Phnomibacter sp.]
MFIIAEIAQAHDGSLGILHSYIDALADTGVDAIKFQTHIADAESSLFEPFRVPFSYVDKTRYEYWKRMEFTAEQWAGIQQHCQDRQVEFISSPFSCAAVELLENLGVKRYKIGSGEVTNYLMLHRIAQTGKPVILSSGMSHLEELDETINFLKARDVDLSLLQCTTAYPTLPAQWGLAAIPFFKNRYNITVGYSDHSATPEACIAATALGAEILEFHAVFDRRMFGPDAKASLEIDEIRKLVKAVKAVKEAVAANFMKQENKQVQELKTMFGKTLAVNKNLPAGHLLQLHDLESKKPAGKGIAAREFEQVLGKALRTPLSQWDFLTKEALEDL